MVECSQILSLALRFLDSLLFGDCFICIVVAMQGWILKMGKGESLQWPNWRKDRIIDLYGPNILSEADSHG